VPPEVSNPATCLTVAVFDAEAHGARHEHDFLGLVRVGASVLPTRAALLVSQSVGIWGPPFRFDFISCTDASFKCK